MKPLYLFALSFLLIFSSLAVASKGTKGKEMLTARVFNSTFNGKKITMNDLPILGANTELPNFSAYGILARDADSSVVLFEKNSDTKLLPASTTKIMTALVAMDYYKDDQIIKVGPVNVAGQKMLLHQGEEITFENLLSGLLMYSANDAAEVLAANYEGGREAFIEAMNDKSRIIHLDNTHFANPTGLDEDNHYSTAKDMVRLSEIAMENPKFAQIVATRAKVVKSVDNKFIHNLININELLGKIDGVKGVKTGWTEGARENLITYIERNNKRVYIALLGSEDRFGETEKLIDWIFTNYNWTPLDTTNSFYSP
jgi:D-alanyl-D-alanine carboxypeptidase